MKLINPSEITDKNFLDWKSQIVFFEDQIIPIYTPYCEKEGVVIHTPIVLAEFVNGNKCELSKGDKIHLVMESPRNSPPDSANSYKLVIDKKGEQYYKYYPILNLITESCEGGTLSTLKEHYDATLQIKNLHKIIFGHHETKVEYELRELKVIAEVIPEKDFYVGKPYNSRSGYEVQKVLFKDGKYLRLRGLEWQTAEMLGDSYKEEDERGFNVWGEYNNKDEMAWHILHNACLILETPDQANEPDIWSKQFNYYQSETIKRYEKENNNQKTTV